MGTVLCPVCRAPRKRNLSEHVPLSGHLKIFLGVALLCSLTYILAGPLLAFKFSFIYLPLWMIAEAVHGLKMRKDLKCPVCGFDPVLYQKDWKEARRIVEGRLQGVVSDLKVKYEEERQKLKPEAAKPSSSTTVSTAAPPASSLAVGAKRVVALKTDEKSQNP